MVSSKNDNAKKSKRREGKVEDNNGREVNNPLDLS